MLSLLTCAWVATASPISADDTNSAVTTPPRVFILDGRALVDGKRRVRNADTSVSPALIKLRYDADRALSQNPVSVTEKSILPPSGDKHDYMSLAPYWWPNPNTPIGLPYVRRDGMINSERDRIPDKKNLENMVTSVETLALAYYFSGRQQYAEHAARILEVWFLDPESRMNPNLKYAQAIPGRSQGRGAGIIETHRLPSVVDAAGLLAGSTAWSEKQQRHLESWFDAYLNWLLQSPQGRHAAQAQNNHGSWYDVQVISFALYTERKDVARRILSEVPSKRIGRQIAPDGRQPHELARTRPWHYSLFNLEALFQAAALGEKLDLDLWSFVTTDGRSIRRALDWLTPFALGEKPWAPTEVSRWDPRRLAPLLQRAALRYQEPSYGNASKKLYGAIPDPRVQLVYPMPDLTTDPANKPALGR